MSEQDPTPTEFVHVKLSPEGLTLSTNTSNILTTVDSVVSKVLDIPLDIPEAKDGMRESLSVEGIRTQQIDLEINPDVRVVEYFYEISNEKERRAVALGVIGLLAFQGWTSTGESASYGHYLYEGFLGATRIRRE